MTRVEIKCSNSSPLGGMVFCRIATVVVALGFSLPVKASLGGNVSSVHADSAHMSASEDMSENDNYQLHQLKLPTGTEVSEYVSSSGTVFAVSWHGPFMPDMQQLLGSYFDQYSAALSSQSREYGRHPLDIHQTGLVVQTGGHMRAHWGRVYVPALAPQGLSVEKLQ